MIMSLVGSSSSVSLLTTSSSGILDMSKGEFSPCMNYKVTVESSVAILRKVIKVLKCKFISKMCPGISSSLHKGPVRNFETKPKALAPPAYKSSLISTLTAFIRLFLVPSTVSRKFEMSLRW